MVSKRNKVFVALSGGVDSSTAAALLRQKGFDCAGVFMITSDQASVAQADAEKVAKKLGIKLYVLDLRTDFEQILEYFCSEYRKGRTPNPCVFCNRYIKFGKLWDFARNNGADLLATGHYARILDARCSMLDARYSILDARCSMLDTRCSMLDARCSILDARKREESRIGNWESGIENDEVGLYEAVNPDKDQSYVLSMIDKDILGHIILPMGDHSKDQTRELAAKLGLGTAEKQESQEICFIPNGDWVAVLEQRCPELVRKGNIVDSSGRVLGKHNGVHRFTIGQRRGLRVAMGKPYYVVKIDAESNTVTLGPKEELMHKKLLATEVNWLASEPISPFRATVKVRYNDSGAAALVSPQANGAVVEFDAPIPAITPGQLAAFCVQEGADNRVVGGGWIEKVGHGSQVTK